MNDRAKGRQERAAMREKLMLAVLGHVPFDGWTVTALNAGAKDVELPEGNVARLFPGGPADVIALFSAWADARMVEAMGAADAAALRLHERVALGVRARLIALMPYREAARRAATSLALPSHAPLAARLLYRTVDTIWRAAGDRPTDFSYYTKRAILAGVYTATLLHWFDDRSENSVATWGFLDRRLADVGRLGAARERVSRFASRLPDPLGVIRRFSELRSR
jgi:ubiquinone biosynthesis protein COQ9